MKLSSKIEKQKVKGRKFTVDLRIHSPASLGYIGVEGLDTAPALVRLAKVKGIDVIAVTDYHCGAYIDRISQAAKNSQVTLIPGVDIRCKVASCDDIILTVLFPEETSSAVIEEFLDSIDVPFNHRGNQNFINKTPLKLILEKVRYFQGFAFPSRIDKTPQRMQAIKILVEEFNFTSFDLAYSESADYFKKNWPKKNFRLFSFSDANALAQVGSRTAEFRLSAPNFQSIKEYLSN